MYTCLWTGPTFVHYALENEPYSETDDPILIYSLHKQGQYNKVSSVPTSYKQDAFVNSLPRQNVLTSYPAPMCLMFLQIAMALSLFKYSVHLSIWKFFQTSFVILSKLLSPEHIQLHSLKISIFFMTIFILQCPGMSLISYLWNSFIWNSCNGHLTKLGSCVFQHLSEKHA